VGIGARHEISVGVYEDVRFVDTWSTLPVGTLIYHHSKNEAHGRRVPVQYHINHEDEFIALRFEGEVDLVDVYELCQALIADPGFDPKFPQLADVREIELKLTSGAMRPFLNYVTSKYRPLVNAPIAVVLDGSMDDAFCAGVFRFVCKLSDTEVFDDYALAIKWLLRDNWPGRNRKTLSQPEDSGRDQGDEHPKQIRA
jgi:hypothetical protein